MCDGNLAMANILEVEIETKICVKCGEEKSLSEFYKTASHTGGYSNICKTCNLKYRLAHKKHIEELKTKSIFFYGEKVPLIKSKHQPTNHINYGTTAARYRLKVLGVDVSGKQVHHWNYNNDMDVILIPKKAHKLIHRLMTYDTRSKMFFVNGTNILLNTKEMHCEFIDAILEVFKIEKQYWIFNLQYIPKNKRIKQYIK